MGGGLPKDWEGAWPRALQKAWNWQAAVVTKCFAVTWFPPPSMFIVDESCTCTLHQQESVFALPPPFETASLGNPGYFRAHIARQGSGFHCQYNTSSGGVVPIIINIVTLTRCRITWDMGLWFRIRVWGVILIIFQLEGLPTVGGAIP